MLSLFFVLVLLTVFAMQWNPAEVRKDFPLENPSAGPEALQRTLEKIPAVRDSQQNLKRMIPESYLNNSGTR